MLSSTGCTVQSRSAVRQLQSYSRCSVVVNYLAWSWADVFPLLSFPSFPVPYSFKSSYHLMLFFCSCLHQKSDWLTVTFPRYMVYACSLRRTLGCCCWIVLSCMWLMANFHDDTVFVVVICRYFRDRCILWSLDKLNVFFPKPWSLGGFTVHAISVYCSFCYCFWRET